MSATQPAVDRSDTYNQTFEHDHRDGVVCQCGHNDNVAATHFYCGKCGTPLVTDAEHQGARCDACKAKMADQPWPPVAPAPADVPERRQYSRPPDYKWTASHGKLAYCPDCKAERPTYGELKGGKLVEVCCATCQRILHHENETVEPRGNGPVVAGINTHKAAYVPTHAQKRIDELETKLRTSENQRADLIERLRVAEERILGFEAMTASLAKHIDEMQADIIFQGGGDGGSLPVDVINNPRQATANAICFNIGHHGPCMLPVGHKGQCDAGTTEN